MNSYFVLNFEVVPFFLAAISSDWTNVEHAVTILDEGSSLDGDFQVSDVPQAKVDDILQLLFAEFCTD